MLVTLALAANLDNLGVGIAYGLKRTSITPTANLLIALLAGELTFLAMAFGHWVNQVLSASMANALGAFLILGVGLWVYFGNHTTTSLASVSSLVLATSPCLSADCLADSVKRQAYIS